MKKVVVLILFSLIQVILYGQEDSIDTSGTGSQSSSVLEKIVSPSIVKLTGEAGVYGELYSIKGRDKRRPSSSGRIFFRPTLTLFENFSINFDVMLSTEGNDARQQINQVGIHPEWGWGKLHLGDFSHEFSRFTLSGVTIRGAGVELHPGILRFQAVGGQTQRAVEAGPYSSTYSRYLAGLKLGIGNEDSYFVDLNIIRAKDNTASLPAGLFVRDSSSSSSQFGITPQENIAMGLNTEFRLFNNMIRFAAEGAASVFTRDMNSTTFTAEEIKDNGLPGFINNIYKLRISTNADFAYNTEIGFNHNIVTARLAYSVINPGYTSLGLGSFINDKRNVNFNSSLRLLDNRLTLQGNFQLQNDNLLKQKLNTTTRTAYSVTANIRALRELSFVLNTMQNIMANDSKNDTTKIKNVNSAYSVNMMLQLNLFNLNHSISAAYSTQQAEDQNILRKGNEVNSNNISMNINTIVNKYLTVSPGITINTVDVKNRSKNTTSSYNLRVSSRMFNSKLSNSFNVTYTDAATTSSIIMLQSAYSLTSVDNITFSVRSSFYQGKDNPNLSYQEHKANLGYTHRF